MLIKHLSFDEKLVFGRNLHECATLNVKAQVTEEYQLATGYSAQSYKDKMCGHRKFAEMELDIVIASFQRAYGQEAFVTRFRENFDALPFPSFWLPDADVPVETTDDGYDPRLPIAGKDQFCSTSCTLHDDAAFQRTPSAGRKSFDQHVKEKGFFPKVEA